MIEHLGIEFTEIGEDYLKGTMPVDHRTHQPAGILHGGASVALAETLGSSAANLVVDNGTHRCVGLEINANHIRSCAQVWEIRIMQNEQLICVSRLTMATLEK